MIVRFADFEFDRDRAELRGADGGLIKLRTKTFEMLALFTANAGRVLSKQQLMEAVWADVQSVKTIYSNASASCGLRSATSSAG